MAGGVAFVFGFIAVVFLQHAAAQTVHVVGDATGWTIPDAPTFYSDWASKNKFAVGDSLKFNFPTGAHDVLKVSKASFEACDSENGIGNTMTMGPATVKLDAAGEHYFICTVGKHCSGGQKLAVTVSAAAGGAASPSSNTTTQAPTAAKTPAAHDHANAPKTTDANAPNSADSPSSSTPTGDGSPAAQAPSSSTAVMATLYVTFSAIVMSFFF